MATKAIPNKGFSGKMKVSASNEISNKMKRKSFESLTGYSKNVSNKAKATTPLNPFGFLPTHIAYTKNQKSLNFSQRKKKDPWTIKNTKKKIKTINFEKQIVKKK